MALIHVDKTNWDELTHAKNPVLLDFYADWCGPCRMLAPTLEEIAAERPDVTVAKINVDELPELAGAFGIVSIPTLVVLKEGVAVGQSVGVRPKEQILAML